MASSSSSSSSQNWLYHVFPSFSGEDVRKTFLSHFLKELERKQIIAFKDYEIQRGHSLNPELKRAIKNSRIAVVVLSKNYASSSWCLNELLEILKCEEESGQMVIPVFYGLDPSHVRKQNGDFGKIFAKTCQYKTEDEKNQWKGALTYVADILGFHSVTCENEANMVEEIANAVLDKLDLSSSNAYKDFVGIEDHMSQISSLLHLESEEVRMVGIWGPSGIGKTTIARDLYRRISSQFQSTVFIDKVFISSSSEVYSRASLVDFNVKLHLQQKFLAKVLGKKNMKIDDLDAIEKMLKHRKTLIFIDDLDDQDVLDALAGHTQWFGSGSRIIVVTKDMQFLRAHGIKHIYQVCLPSEKLALQMFCRYAFRKNFPPDDFRKLSSEIVLLAGNLPLGLAVFGSSLRGRDKEDWMDMMPRFRIGLDSKIEQTLRVSYDGLDKKDEAIFRHIACIFNGKKVVDIKLLLADSNLDINIGLKNLIDKSLIHERWHTVEMHSLLQEMGKEIVRKQSDKPGEREFLVDTKDICDVFEHNSGTEKVLGITFNEEVDELRLHESSFKGMSNLLFLEIYNKNPKKEVRWHLPERFDYWPTKLRLLRLDGYPKRCMPSNFRPENLVKLHMRKSKLEKLWDGVHSLTGLKNVDLSKSRNLKEIPDLTNAFNLEILRLNNCSSLVKLPYSIQSLNKLEELEMQDCENLESLPTGINLQSLWRLHLRGCSRLRSFPDISTNILCLELGQTAIEEIPSNSRLENLVDFCMGGTGNLGQSVEKSTAQPIGFAIRMALRASATSFLTRPCLFHPPFLALSIPKLQTMQYPSLRTLLLFELPCLVEFPSSLQNLHNLKILCIYYCRNLETLPTGINLESLDELSLSGCSRLSTFPEISTNISTLCLDKTGIKEVPGWIEEYKMLRSLSMRGCNDLLEVSLNILKLENLTADFSDCGALTKASWNYSSNEVATETGFNPGVKLDFTHCFKFDPKALIQQQHGLFKKLVLQGEEVPSYFTHRTTGTSLTNIPLLHTSPSHPYSSFRCCVAVHGAITWNNFKIHVYLRSTDRFETRSYHAETTGSILRTVSDGNLYIIDYPASLPHQLNCGHMDIEFSLVEKEDRHELKIKGCGIRVFDVDPFLDTRVLPR